MLLDVSCGSATNGGHVPHITVAFMRDRARCEAVLVKLQAEIRQRKLDHVCFLLGPKRNPWNKSYPLIPLVARKSITSGTSEDSRAAGNGDVDGKLPAGASAAGGGHSGQDVAAFDAGFWLYRYNSESDSPRHPHVEMIGQDDLAGSLIDVDLSTLRISN